MKSFIIQYWMQVLFGLMTFVTGIMARRVNKEIKKNISMQNALQALLRDRIIQQYSYHMERGFCPIYAKESIHLLGIEYVNLGGNGVTPQLVQELSELPTDRKFIKDSAKEC